MRRTWQAWYPKGERPDDESVVTGIEWDHGVYLGQDITRIDFDMVEGKRGRCPARRERI